MKQWCKMLNKNITFKIAVDTAPVLERALAVKSGMGFIGKNTNCISPEKGSWFFIAEVGVDILLPHSSPINMGCRDCRLCLDNCPTGALVEPYTLDAGKCLSYLTIEHKGVIPEKYYSLIGNRIFGCDRCQEVCPYNKKPSVEAFLRQSPMIPSLSLDDVWECYTNEKFKNKFRNSPIKRLGRLGLWRNAAIVAGNIKDFNSIPVLKMILKNESDAGLCSAACWALDSISVARDS
jgi:epoxyqueuosine reductase